MYISGVQLAPLAGEGRGEGAAETAGELHAAHLADVQYAAMAWSCSPSAANECPKPIHAAPKWMSS